MGTTDGRSAVTVAAKEGFRSSIVIFLDQEEGGWLLPEQLVYVFAWVGAVRAGGDQTGIYLFGYQRIRGWQHNQYRPRHCGARGGTNKDS